MSVFPGFWVFGFGHGLLCLNDNGFQFSENSETADDLESGLPRLLFRSILADTADTGWEIDGLNMLDLRNWNLHAIDADGS